MAGAPIGGGLWVRLWRGRSSATFLAPRELKSVRDGEALVRRAPAVSTKSSDELSVAAGVEAVSLASRGSHECQQEMPPGVGHAPDVQGTASDVVQAEGIPATAEREGQGQRSGVGNTVDLNVSPDICCYQARTTTRISSPTTPLFTQPATTSAALICRQV